MLPLAASLALGAQIRYPHATLITLTSNPTRTTCTEAHHQMADCLFCKIARGEIPAQIVHQDDTVTAFRDINPQAPVHVLVIPNQHVGSAAEIGPGNGALMAALIVT